MYPGSFDPPTNGHLDIARRAASLFDTLIVALSATPAKNLLFSSDERLRLWKEIVDSERLPSVQVESYTGLPIDYVRSVGGHVVIKGLRSPCDFEAELQQGLMNGKLAPEIETICLLASFSQVFVISSLLKEVARLGGEVADLLPNPVLRALQRKFAMK